MGIEGLVAAAVAAAAAALAGVAPAGVAPWPLAAAIGAVAGVAAAAAARAVARPAAEAAPPATTAAAAAPRAEAPAPAPDRELLDRLPLGLLLIDGRGRVAFQNAAAEEVMERAVRGLHHAAALRAPALVEAVGAAFAEGRSSEVDVGVLKGKERSIHGVVRPLPGGGDRPAVMVLLEDRTRMAKAEAMRRDFVANASHELKTPLASIAGFIETLQGHAREDPEAAERFLGIMAQQAERMKRLVEDLLSLNRIEINEHVQPREAVDLGAAAREAASALTPVAEAEGARLEVETPQDGPLVRGDAGEIAQVLVNLIDNALKYAGAHGPVRVTVATDPAERPGMVGVTVADCGPGIPREHLPRLTERFYRVSAARSRERGGTGLGLAIAKHIMNRHRGELAISSAPGQGSRFTAWFPAYAADRRRPGEAA